MTALLALIEGLAREFVRDRTALFFTLLFPVVFMLILGLFFSGIGGGAEYDVGVVDRDQTATSAGVVIQVDISVDEPENPVLIELVELVDLRPGS